MGVIINQMNDYQFSIRNEHEHFIDYILFKGAIISFKGAIISE